jgi:hypothetical protein
MYTQNWYSTVAMGQMEEDRIRKVTAYLTLNYLAFQSLTISFSPTDYFKSTSTDGVYY